MGVEEAGEVSFRRAGRRTQRTLRWAIAYKYPPEEVTTKLLDKETLRRQDLEGIFEGIEPRAAFDVYPTEDDD